MKGIKTITVASDLSQNARVAYNYAWKLAHELDVDMHVVNIYLQPTLPNSSNFLGYMPSPDELKQDALKQLRHFANDVSVKCEVHAGADSDTLIDLSKKWELLVVGAKGEKGMIDNMIGSVSLGVSRDAFCPVLVIPEKSKFVGIKQILYATSESSLKTKHIEKVMSLAKKLGSKIHFVHVSENKGSFDISAIDTLMSAYEVPYEKADLEFISERGGMDIYREKNAINLIVVATQHRSLWERIFHSSFTEALQWNTEVPVLVLHDEDEI